MIKVTEVAFVSVSAFELLNPIKVLKVSSTLVLFLP